MPDPQFGLMRGDEFLARKPHGVLRRQRALFHLVGGITHEAGLFQECADLKRKIMNCRKPVKSIAAVNLTSQMSLIYFSLFFFLIWIQGAAPLFVATSG